MRPGRNMKEKSKTIIRTCSLEITAKELDPEAVSAALGVSPDRCCRRGDHLRGTTLHHQGGWVVESSARITSEEPNDHLEFIAKFAMTHSREICEIRTTLGVKVGIRFLWEFGETTLVFGLDRQILSGLSEVVDWIGISIT